MVSRKYTYVLLFMLGLLTSFVLKGRFPDTFVSYLLIFLLGCATGILIRIELSNKLNCKQ